jgi:hypothetical protein
LQPRGAPVPDWRTSTPASRDAELGKPRLGVIGQNLVPDALWSGTSRGTEEAG